MKTPREILQHHHAAAGLKLDAVRRTVMEKLYNQETKEQSFRSPVVALLLGCSEKLWRELVWPVRQAWAGLAAVWMALMIFNLTHAEPRQAAIAKSNPSSAAVRLAFQEQQQLLDEIIGQVAPASPAVPLRRPNNRPRSETRALVSLA